MFQLRSGLPPTGQLDVTTLDARGLSPQNFAYLEPTRWSYESWGRASKRFKHGKWKVKWKKHHRDESDEYGDEEGEGNGVGHWHRRGRDD